MAYEVSAAGEVSDRLVVSVGGVSLVYGEPLDSDRDAEGVVIVAEQEDGKYVSENRDLGPELLLLSERYPEVAEAVQVEAVPEEVPVEDQESVLEVELGPTPDPADQVVPAGETTPSVERIEVQGEASDGETADVVLDQADKDARDGADNFENEGGN
jgi:hypothetical protein